MTASLMRCLRLRTVAMLVAVLLPWFALPASGDELADFQEAVALASAQYRVAMTTLETRGREETSAAVQRFRQAWQIVIDRRGSSRPAASTDAEQYAGLFMQVDARIVGALIVIDIGSREAARDALAPIAETLSQLSAAPAAPR
jgi:hypothetical protein